MFLQLFCAFLVSQNLVKPEVVFHPGIQERVKWSEMGNPDNPGHRAHLSKILMYIYGNNMDIFWNMIWNMIWNIMLLYNGHIMYLFTYGIWYNQRISILVTFHAYHMHIICIHMHKHYMIVYGIWWRSHTTTSPRCVAELLGLFHLAGVARCVWRCIATPPFSDRLQLLRPLTKVSQPQVSQTRESYGELWIMR